MNAKLFDVVAVLKLIAADQLILVEPEYDAIAFLPIGLVGTIVEVHHHEAGDRFLVEFADAQGNEYAMAILSANDFVVLRYEVGEVRKDLATT
jgi:hypothetical protein